MRYTVQTTEEKTEIEFKNRIYIVDDTVQGFINFSKVMNDKNTEIEDILTVALGEEACKEIMSENPRYSEIQELCITIGAAFKGVSPEELKKTIDKTAKK